MGDSDDREEFVQSTSDKCSLALYDTASLDTLIRSGLCSLCPNNLYLKDRSLSIHNDNPRVFDILTHHSRIEPRERGELF
jgi:hypothetical protein